MDVLLAGMSVEIDGENLTMPQAGKRLQSEKREIRKAAFDAINRSSVGV